jgi:hypothetical protein
MSGLVVDAYDDMEETEYLLKMHEQQAFAGIS